MPKANVKADDDLLGEALLEVFCENIRVLREGLKISQSELARRAHRSAGYICDLEHRRRGVNLGTVAVIANALGVTVPVLLSDSNGKTP